MFGLFKVDYASTRSLNQRSGSLVDQLANVVARLSNHPLVPAAKRKKQEESAVMPLLGPKPLACKRLIAHDDQYSRTGVPVSDTVLEAGVGVQGKELGFPLRSENAGRDQSGLCQHMGLHFLSPSGSSSLRSLAHSNSFAPRPVGVTLSWSFRGLSLSHTAPAATQPPPHPRRGKL